MLELFLTNKIYHYYQSTELFQLSCEIRSINTTFRKYIGIPIPKTLSGKEIDLYCAKKIRRKLLHYIYIRTIQQDLALFSNKLYIHSCSTLSYDYKCSIHNTSVSPVETIHLTIQSLDHFLYGESTHTFSTKTPFLGALIILRNLNPCNIHYLKKNKVINNNKELINVFNRNKDFLDEGKEIMAGMKKTEYEWRKKKITLPKETISEHSSLSETKMITTKFAKLSKRLKKSKKTAKTQTFLNRLLKIRTTTSLDQKKSRKISPKQY
ncbi:MAG: hypothetical protein HeimC3_52430 [Candidatus Heimdallarchaeota archaeon LC_3]|nr:MAG: hypothetical protein HeimC3_52430 [Candidatus Heimdallarchaeota archaeon LC_3]